MSNSHYRNIKPNVASTKGNSNSSNITPSRVVRDERMYENLEDMHEAAKPDDKTKSASKGRSVNVGRSTNTGRSSGNSGLGTGSGSQTWTIIKNCENNERWSVQRNLVIGSSSKTGIPGYPTAFFKDPQGTCFQIIEYAKSSLGYRVYKYGKGGWPKPDGNTYDTCSECIDTYTYYKNCNTSANFAVATGLTGYGTFFKLNASPYTTYQIESYGNDTDGGRSIVTPGAHNSRSYSNCNEANLRFAYFRDQIGRLYYTQALSVDGVNVTKFYIAKQLETEGIYQALQYTALDQPIPTKNAGFIGSHIPYTFRGKLVVYTSMADAVAAATALSPRRR